MVPRLLTDRLVEALAHRPVVFLTGPRQSGKSTLARALADYHYITLDSLAALDAARSDPEGFVRGLPDRVVIDEVQRAPALFVAVKASVDDDRTPGRFLLTGSTSALAVPQAADALVGRMSLLTLWPFSQREVAGGAGSVCDWLFGNNLAWAPHPAAIDPLAQLVVRGGYPEPLTWAPDDRQAWFGDYVATVLQRDVRDIADIAGIASLPRLLAVLASRCANLLNAADVSRTLGMPYATLDRYLALLQAVYLWAPVRPWSSNLGSRAVKASKVALCDTGLACSALRLDVEQLRAGAMLGPLVENLVATELRKDAGWSRTRPDLYHYRDSAGREVDLVLEGPGGRVVGVEVKAAATVAARDTEGLRYLADRLGDRFVRGVVLYDGAATIPFAANIHAVPLSALWTA